MGALNNLYVSSSFQGLLKLTNSATGLTSTLQTIQAGDGSDGPLQMSLTEVNISGSFTVNNLPITGSTSGTSGTSGSSGTAGSNGSSGTSGTSGSSGSSGTSGSNGSSGTSGTSGINGTSGTSGFNGSSGTSGTSGSSGSSGTSGSSGSSGTSGTSGSSGSSGTSGSSGSTGTSGTSGTSGVNGSSGTSGRNGGVIYQFDTTTTGGGTGTGRIRYNNAIISSVTRIFISEEDISNDNVNNWILSWDDSTTTTNRGQITIMNNTSSDLGGLFNVTGVTVTQSGYYEILVQYVSGQLPANTNSLSVSFSRTGNAGSSGTSGINGTSGTSGVNGTSGTSGTSGSSGSSGTNGTSGTSGSSGSSGTSGTDGQSNTFFDYNANTTSTSGNPGNSYILWNNVTQSGATQINISHLDANNYDIDVFLGLIPSGSTIIIQDLGNSNNYQKWIFGTGVEIAPNSYWTFPATLVQSTHEFSNNNNVLLIIGQIPSGTSGTSGTSGINGTSGTSGSNGSSGTSGSSGNSGTDGSSGTSGSSGSSGTSGSSGSSGTSGINGTSGTSGSDGSSGTSGISGTSGTSGSSGSSGTSGINGTSGTSGNDGTSGTSGINGTSGTSGTSGINGTSGTSGVDGTSGTSGTSGVGTSGTSGTSGIDGTSGTSGINGTSGTSGTSGLDGTSGTSGTSGIGVAGSSGTSGTSGSGTSGTSGTSGFSLFAQTGSFYATTNDIQITGSLLISGSNNYDLVVTGSARFVNPSGTQINTITPNTFNVNTTNDPTLNAENYIFASTASNASVYVGVYDDPNFTEDVELKINASTSGLQFQDWDNVTVGDYVDWMTIAPNLGNNPAPQFKRSVGVTGSINITGQYLINGSPIGGGGGGVTQITGVTLSSGSWSVSGSLYEYSYSNTGITTSSFAQVIPNNSDINTVINAQILPQVITQSGSLKIYSTFQPSSNIGVTINLQSII